MEYCRPWLRSQRRVLNSTQWPWPAELKSVLVIFGNGILLPSPRAPMFLLYSGYYLALQTENKKEESRGKLTVLMEVTTGVQHKPQN